MFKFIQKLLRPHVPGTEQVQPADNQPVVVVSGLPRSGTSLMMKMLEAGGLPVLVDHIREADSDNPKGYYEYERVKKLDKGDAAWVASAQGHAVKIISALLEFLPHDHQYQVIFMRRDLREISQSQQKMLVNRGEPTGENNEAEMMKLFAAHIEHTLKWLATQPHVSVLEVDYNLLLTEPAQQAERINRFLNGTLDAAQMAATVDPKLYRNRA